ncbi:MAG TPA: rRNA maturation RNase YbeY [Thermoanaerobaculia bacterium]|nr:rRNA maturation RNase YbeY [Thermoanaerobaculia bacterium]
MKRRKSQRRAGGALGTVDVLCTVAGAPPAARVRGWTRTLLSKAGAKRASLSILLCGDRRMRTLNRTWRRIDRPTDVLSFLPFAESSSSPSSSSSPFLGDLVIDVPYAARQARRRGHPVAREVQILLAHGLLHLLGYDHETDDGTMFRLQKKLVLAAFGGGPDGAP